ncbi:hypothetical protein F4782DRAFT_536008 [Xylaria castorea]|nr:hypothetical protein F4782DRAFT_536008 [Xylaria castorea]
MGGRRAKAKASKVKKKEKASSKKVKRKAASFATATADENDDSKKWNVERISHIRHAAIVTEQNRGYEYLVHWANAAYEPAWIDTALIAAVAIHTFWLEAKVVYVLPVGSDPPGERRRISQDEEEEEEEEDGRRSVDCVSVERSLFILFLIIFLPL